MSRRAASLTALTVLVGGLLAVVPISEARADPPRCQGQPATLVIDESGPRRVYGTAAADVIVVDAPWASHLVFALGGDDVVCVVGGPQTVHGGPGDDRLSSRDSTSEYGFGSTLIGDGGDDVLVGSPDSDNLDGGGGDDRLLAGDGDDTLFPGPGVDVGRGGDGDGDDRWAADINGTPVRIDAARGRATGQGTDRLVGIESFSATRRNDVFTGSAAADTVVLLGGDDVARARGGRDRLYGGYGDDLLVGGRGADEADGSRGHDDCRAEYVTDCE